MTIAVANETAAAVAAPKYFDKHLLGAILTVTPRTADELMRTGKIRCAVVGRKRVTTQKHIDEFIAKGGARLPK